MRNIKVPRVITYSNIYELSYLIYEKIEGETLSVIFDKLDLTQQQNVCNDILLNFNMICNIRTSGNGQIEGYNTFEYDSWKGFLKEEIAISFKYLHSSKTDFNLNNLYKYLIYFLENRIREAKHLVWSDFNLNNIIISNNGELGGFIDFEGLIGGDPLLGIGYLKAQNGNSNFFKLFSQNEIIKVHKEWIDFYSIIRYLRLIVFSNENLPNGSRRDPINSFLQISHELIKEKSI
jgi:aminoglycoside phosphotransferase (APT) family kinase protein